MSTNCLHLFLTFQSHISWFQNRSTVISEAILEGPNDNGLSCYLLFSSPFIWCVAFVESMLCLCPESRPKTRRPATAANPTEVSQMVMMEDAGYISFSGYILMPCTSCRICCKTLIHIFRKPLVSTGPLAVLNLSEPSTSCLLADRCK